MAEASGSRSNDISFSDVCAYLEDQGDAPNNMSIDAAMPPGDGGSGAAATNGDGAPPLPATGLPMASSGTGGAAESGTSAAADAKGMSHLCDWPGCGKGFASRWSLERHMKNHQPAASGEEEPKPDSFVERRLRERLKSVQQALEKAREKLTQSARQQEQADTELQEARAQGEQQQLEITHLAAQNQQLAAMLPPGVAQRLIASCNAELAVGASEATGDAPLTAAPRPAPPHALPGGGGGGMDGAAAAGPAGLLGGGGGGGLSVLS